jgi:endonuclease/exonuclease/phosphatase family metal-dependent hydrolase
MMITLATVNAWQLYDERCPEPERWRRVEELVAGLTADVVAVQELIADGADERERQAGADAALRRLAGATGMSGAVDGRAVAAAGGGRYHTGLLWRADRVSVRPGSPVRLGRGSHGLWHSMVACVLTVDGTPLRVGSVHLSPHSPPWRAADAYQVLTAMHPDGLPGFVGGDWNSIGASRVEAGDGWRHYDRSPYPAPVWHPAHGYQLDGDGRVDRGAARVLENAGGMRDCAVLAGAPWQPTTGYHPIDPQPPRRIDRWYATHQVPAAAIAGYAVADPDRVGTDTDHRPVLVTVDTAALSGPAAAE